MSTHTRTYARPQQKPVRAFLLGECTVVCNGYPTCTSFAPILDLARLLIARGVDPRTPLKVYRGKVLAVRVRTIGVAAALRVAPHGSGFSRVSGRTGGPPIRLNGEAYPAPIPAPESGGGAP